MVEGVVRWAVSANTDAAALQFWFAAHVRSHRSTDNSVLAEGESAPNHDILRPHVIGSLL